MSLSPHLPTRIAQTICHFGPSLALVAACGLPRLRITIQTARNHAMTAKSLILRAGLSRYKLQRHCRAHSAWTEADERHPAIRQRLFWLAGGLFEEIP